MILRRFMRHSSDAGTALVEFAVALVLILTVVYGIIDLGRAAYAYDWISNASRQGARFMSVRGTGCRTNGLQPCLLSGGDPADADDSANYVKSLAIGIDPSKVTVTTHCFAAHNAFLPPPCAPRGWVSVEVTYQFQWISPLIPAASWNMTSKSQVYVQN